MAISISIQFQTKSLDQRLLVYGLLVSISSDQLEPLAPLVQLDHKE